MKKFIFLTLLISLNILFTGCKDDKKLDVDSEKLTNYISSEMVPLNDQQQELVKSCVDLISDQSNGSDVSTKVTQDIMPNLLKLIESSQAVDIDNPEIKEVHQLYTDALEIFKNAVTEIKNSSENGDLISMFNSLSSLTEFTTALGEYEDELTELCKEYSINVNLPFVKVDIGA